MAFNSDGADSPLPFPIIADDKRELSVQLGMLDPDELDKDGIPLTARCVSMGSQTHPGDVNCNIFAVENEAQIDVCL